MKHCIIEGYSHTQFGSSVSLVWPLLFLLLCVKVWSPVRSLPTEIAFAVSGNSGQVFFPLTKHKNDDSTHYGAWIMFVGDGIMIECSSFTNLHHSSCVTVSNCQP